MESQVLKRKRWGWNADINAELLSFNSVYIGYAIEEIWNWTRLVWMMQCLCMVKWVRKSVLDEKWTKRGSLFCLCKCYRYWKLPHPFYMKSKQSTLFQEVSGWAWLRICMKWWRMHGDESIFFVGWKVQMISLRVYWTKKFCYLSTTFRY